MSGYNCRFCNEKLIDTFVDLGITPLSNSFLTQNLLKKKENVFPLHVYVCRNCLLVQLPEFETPENIFRDYAYFSSYSETWLEHVRNYVNYMIDRFGFNKNNLVVEIASNDGYLLKYFVGKGIPVLGIEPAANVAKIAEQNGVPTLVKFFNTKTAFELSQEDKKADLIIGNNVLAHVPNVNDFVDGMKILLKPGGVITMEFPHILKLIQFNQFDTIYHEHFSYLSLFVVQKIFSSHNLTIFDVEEIETHGGSIRIFVKHSKNKSFQIENRVLELLEKEKKFGLNDLAKYIQFAKDVIEAKERIRKFFLATKKDGKKVVCYGAAAKGNTLLNYCQIGTDFIEYIVDKNIHKQGMFLPGSHIPIKDPKEIKKTKPDYVVILPWNLKDEIMKQIQYIREWGGKFVIPIPEVKIL